MIAESREAHVAFARGSETHAWRADHMGPVQQAVEERPGGHALWHLYPQIGGIFAAIDLETHFMESASHRSCILHVVVDCLLYLCASFW